MSTEITIIGTVNNRVETVYTRNVEKEYLKFSITSFGDNTDLIFDVISFDISERDKVKKGSLIQVIGRFSIGKKRNENNTEKILLRVIADRITLIQELEEEESLEEESEKLANEDKEEESKEEKQKIIVNEEPRESEEANHIVVWGQDNKSW